MRNLVSRAPHSIVEVVSQENYRDYCGLLTGPFSNFRPETALEYGSVWAADNGCFLPGYNPDRILSMLARYSGVPGCKFVVVPDVVRDAAATLLTFSAWVGTYQRYGFPVALAIQNGIETQRIPWDSKKKTWAFSKEKLGFWRLNEFPLLQLMLTRADCIKLVMDAGLPEPPPSLCWWCPFQGRARLLHKKQHQPEMFEEIVRMEDHANAQYDRLNHNTTKKSKAVFFHPDRIPLRNMPNQLTLWDNYNDKDDTCQIGICDV